MARLLYPVMIVQLLWGLMILIGAVMMKNLRNKGLAWTASICAMVPCHPCWIAALPIGIWAAVVLARPEVSSAFE
jgi:hypothetical protein